MPKLLKRPNIILILLFIVNILPQIIDGKNKYSKEKNEDSQDIPIGKNLKKLEKPFRMQKINLVWEKAQKQLSESQLKMLYSDLKIQDKEEIYLKKLKSEGSDKDGLKEAELTKKLNIILYKYKLQKISAKPQTEKNGNSILDNDTNLKNTEFRDKKLNKLWVKAQKSGFTESQLKALVEEFNHHQDKIDQYYYFLDQMRTKTEQNEMNQNKVHEVPIEEAHQTPHHHKIMEKHQELKNDFEYLSRQVLNGDFQFDEPQVEQLWKLAQKANFTMPELESLREELVHFENRIKKLQVLKKEFKETTPTADLDHHEFSVKRLQDYERKVGKYQKDFEDRIYQKHLEL